MQENTEPQPPSQPPPSVFGVPVRLVVILAAILGGAIVLAAMLCNVPRAVSEFKPAPQPTMAPTWTPVPTFTPAPQPTATPKPIADLPLQQLHYNQYRVFHLIYEYQKCYDAHIKPPPPTPVPQTADAGVTPTPTPTPDPTPVPGAFEDRHRPPEHGLTEPEIEDHVLADIGGATRWLIDRYKHGDCAELTQYTVFAGRLAWLHRYSGR